MFESDLKVSCFGGLYYKFFIYFDLCCSIAGFMELTLGFWLVLVFF